MLWTSPIYKLRIPKSEDDEENLKEVVIDVTGSAPPFKEPSDALKDVLREILNNDENNIDSVLEFGAAKLKNIPFILGLGKSVCAVEFKELADNAITKKNIKKCERHGDKFQKLLFPHPFISDQRKYDLALLINVMPVMPVFAERLFVLQSLYEKVKQNKYVLWLAQKEGPYKAIREAGKNYCGDGIWMGKNRYQKTFYRYHKVDEVDEMMALCGFKLIKKFSVPDDARLYQKTDHNLLSGLVTPERIKENIPADPSIKDPVDKDPKIVKKSKSIKPVLPNPKSLSIESLYIERLKSIDPGTDNAELYHRLVSLAIGRIFRGYLRGMELKQEIAGGVKIIDTVFTNSAEDGFFKRLTKKVDCSYPMFEMKNYSVDPSNPEFDQLNGRLTGERGHFGILVCRKIENENKAYERCKSFLSNNYILFLTDQDVIELLEFSRNSNKEDINDFMDKKLKKLIF